MKPSGYRDRLALHQEKPTASPSVDMVHMQREPIISRPAIVGISLWLMMIVGVLGFLGCTTQTRYEVLSFLFDGVPDPNAPVGEGMTRQGRRGRTIFVHQPYVEDNGCQHCHVKSGTEVFSTPAAVSPDVCMKCHEGVMEQYAVMHGPVSANMCMMCHEPHTSMHQSLLRMGSPRLCYECHEPATLTQRVVEHQDLEANCLSCHSGHGGSTRALLKPTAPPPGEPARTPTTTPDEQGAEGGRS